jgi:TolB-like protein
MASDPNKLSRFWQELKRRRVIHVIVVYATASFVIIELVNNVYETINLPEWTPALTLIILAVAFPLAIIFSWIFDVTPEGVQKTKPLKEIKEGTKTAVSSSWRIATFISVVVIIGLIALNLFSGKRVVNIDESLAKSIAVLPFQNFSEDPDQEFMCLGLTDEIINHLFKLESFDKVVSMTSVLNYKDPDRNISFIGDELGVNYILEGTYKKIGENLKVSAQLIEARSDKHIWVQDYSRPYAQIMSVQSEIALQIAHQLDAFVSDEEQQRIEKKTTTSHEAFELYQIGRFFWNKRTEHGFANAIKFFEQAIEIDPAYGMAYAGLADTYILMTILYQIDKRIGRDKAEELAFKALELDSDLSEAYTVLGLIYDWIDWDWEKADEAFQNALLFNPNYSTAHMQYAEFLSVVGRHEEARKHINKAVELDPLSFVIRFLNARIFYNQGYFEEALGQLEKCDVIQKDHPWTKNSMINIYYRLDQEDKAFEIFCENIADKPRFDVEIAEQIFQESGFRAVILWKIEKDIEMVEMGNREEFWIANDLAMIGMYEEALYWLEKAFQLHNIGLIHIGYFIHFKSLHDNPRYQAILEGMGLAD